MRVLIIDDEPNIREVLRELLEAHGHSVIEAETWCEASEILESQIIELAIVDGQFPKNSTARCLGDYGPVLCQQARARGARTLLLSANDELVAQERRAGFPALVKPFAVHALLAAIETPVGVAR